VARSHGSARALDALRGWCTARWRARSGHGEAVTAARTRVLVADGNGADRDLAVLVLRQGLPELAVEGVGDPMALAERLLRPDLAAVVTEQTFAWGDGLELAAAVKRLHPACALVLFTAAPADQVVAAAIDHDVDAVAFKGAPGFLALAGAVRAAIARAARRDAARAGEERYRTLLGEMPVGVATLSAQGIIESANPAAARLLGGGDAGVAGAFLPGLLADAGRDRLARLIESGQAVRGLESQVRRAAGATVWVRVNAWPLAAPGRPVARWEVCLEDISTYRQTERQLEERAAQLARSNAELQQFSYAISHDLQEPLQLVTRYGQLLADEQGTRLDASGHRWLAHMLTAVVRMQAMINDVLEYSRVETRGEAFVPIDFGAVVAEALANLKAAIDESQAEVTVQKLPRAAADPRQMVQLFQNLIGNAVKFRSAAPPRVHVSAVESEDAWVFAVMDNGIGMDPDATDRIFGMFQRLHAPGEYPGTGIGLALCKRIVERHGGQIWATSQPGEGSTFYVSLPRQPLGASDGGADRRNGGEHGRQAAARASH
jgi:PAS domain S-box-containing protein